MYEIYGGSQWETQLKRQYPQEHEGIDKFFRMLNGAYDWHLAVFGIKLVPLWLVKFLFRTGLLELISRTFGADYRGRTLKDVIESVTHDKDLREVLAFR